MAYRTMRIDAISQLGNVHETVIGQSLIYEFLFLCDGDNNDKGELTKPRGGGLVNPFGSPPSA